MADIFLSYSREDQATARRYAEALEREGFSVWWDQTLRSGDNYDEVTENALRSAKAVVVLWSRTSVASRWVRAEATTADRRGTLVPVMIEPCERPVMFELKHTAELAHWNGDAQDPAWRGYVEDVRRQVQGQGRDAMPAAATAAAAAPPRRTPWLAFGLAAAVVIAAGVFWLVKHPTAPASESTASSATQAEVVTLAVLPFADLSATQDQEYYSDGLTEEILNQLAQIRGLRVTGRTSSFAFKGRNEDLREIARQLGVARLLEGSIRKDGERLRITAQLIDGATGGHLWSNAYDREQSEAFAVQEEIAKDVARALSIVLDVGDLSRSRGGTTNVEAYEKYLRALDLFKRPGTDNAQILPLLREAVKVDPEFKLAWFTLFVFLQPLASGDPANSAALLQEREEIGRRLESMELPGSLAFQFRGWRAWDQRNWIEALAPDIIAATEQDTPHFAGMAHMNVGRFSDAIPHLRRAVAADPALSTPSDLLFLAYALLGQFNDANAELQRAAKFGIDIAANRVDFFTATTSAERMESIRQQLHGLDEAATPPYLRELVRDADDPARVRMTLRRMFESPAAQSETPIAMVASWAGPFGELDLAIAALRRNWIERKGGYIPAIWVSPEVRADPRFKQILRDLHIVDYWRASGKWGDLCKQVGEDDFECR